jgi:hypothetical protein
MAWFTPALTIALMRAEPRIQWLNLSRATP